jgi:hypothetical protein
VELSFCAQLYVVCVVHLYLILNILNFFSPQYAQSTVETEWFSNTDQSFSLKFCLSVQFAAFYDSQE